MGQPETTPDPDLQTFVAGLRRAVDDFEKNWIAQRKLVPDDWPERMGEADWHEQFVMWLSNGGDL